MAHTMLMPSALGTAAGVIAGCSISKAAHGARLNLSASVAAALAWGPAATGATSTNQQAS